MRFYWQRILGLPLLSFVGIYYIVQAQWEWFSQPLISEKETFRMAVLGMFLVFTQGWHSRRTDWQPLVENAATPRHLLDSPNWPIALLGLSLSVFAAWRKIEHDQVLIPLFVIGIALICWACVPRKSPLSWHQFLPVIKWLLALAGIWLCLDVGWHGVQLDTHVLRLLERWGLGLMLVIVGLVPTSAILEWGRGLWRSWHEQWLEWVTVLLITGVALAVRFAWLETEPYIQSDDEAAFAIQAVDLVEWSKWIDNPFRYDSWQGHPMLYHMTQLAAIRWFGQTVAAARMPSALMGGLTIPAVYLLARRMFNWRVALVGSIFMATYPVHVHFSRLGINQVGDPFFATLAFAFLTHALRKGDAMEFGLAGLTLGLSQYFYSGARIVPLLALGYIAIYAILSPRWIKQRGDLVLITVIVAACVTFPNLYSIHKDTERPFSPRLDHVAIFKTGDIQLAGAQDRLEEYWQDQFTRSFGAFTHRVDKGFGFYGVHGSLMGWYGSIPLMIGIALCLRRWRDPRWLILPLWIAGSAILGAVLLVDPPHFTRYVSASPALAIVIGLGFTYVFEVIQDLPSQLGIRSQTLWSNVPVQTATILVTLLLIAGLNLFDYTYDYLPARVYFGDRTVKLNEAAWELKKLDLDHLRVYYFSSGDLNLSGSSLIRYQTAQRGEEYTKEPQQVHALPFGDYIFVAAADRYEDLVGIVNQVPWGEMRQYKSEQGQDLLYIYFVTLPRATAESGELAQ